MAKHLTLTITDADFSFTRMRSTPRLASTDFPLYTAARTLTSVCAGSPITSSGICANDRATAEALRIAVVDKVQRPPSAIAEQTHGTTSDRLPMHSLQTLLADLATLALCEHDGSPCAN